MSLDERDFADSKIPSQKELEKELSEYLSKKYGGKVKIIPPKTTPKPKEGEPRPSKPEEGGIDFDLLPEELEAYLDSFVVKQKEAKAVLATKICTHFNRIKYNKQRGKKRGSKVGMIKNNVLMIGPTGVGKTYMVKLIAERLGVPFVKGDATKFSETGYVGGDVEDLIRDLYFEANENIELAESGIVYLDEVDKIASAPNIIGHDVSRTGVQRALLKPMEETEVDIRVLHDPISQIQAIEHYRRTGKRERKVINTRNILFIMSGAFNGLTDIIKRRLQRQGIGFGADIVTPDMEWDIMKKVTAQDLIEYGFESEFVGRLPVVVVLDELTKEDLVEILKNPNSPVVLSKRMDFRAYGIDIAFEEEALEKIAEMAATQKTGARGLVSILEKALIPFEKRLPSTGIKEFLVTKEIIENTPKCIEEFMANPSCFTDKERFRRAKEKEFQDIIKHVDERVPYFSNKYQLPIGRERIELVSSIYDQNLCDINSAFQTFKDMVDEIKEQELEIFERLELKVVFEDEAIDELIRQALQKGESPGELAFQLVKRMEYGLKLVKDKAGIEVFNISRRAVLDMEGHINELIKKSYREEALFDQTEKELAQ